MFRIWAQLLDRAQQRTVIIYIPVTMFDQVVCQPLSDPVKSNGADVEMSQVEDSGPSVPVASFNSTQNSIKILHEETSDVWINVG